MNLILKFLFGLADPFIRNPEWGYFMAIGFAILGVISAWRAGEFRPVTHLIMISASVFWLLFTLNEIHAKAAGWNIRVDLLVSLPVLFGVSMASVWLGIGEFAVGKSTERKVVHTPEAD